MELRTRIKNRRIELGLSQEQLGILVGELEGLKKPLSYQAVQHWESGSSIPRHRRLKHIAAALKLPLEELLSLPSAATAVYAPPPPAYGLGWPFTVITRDQISQMPATRLAALEKAMVAHLLDPMPIDYRALALEVAGLYQPKQREEILKFIRAVDLKAAVVRASAQPALHEAPT